MAIGRRSGGAKSTSSGAASRAIIKQIEEKRLADEKNKQQVPNYGGGALSFVDSSTGKVYNRPSIFAGANTSWATDFLNPTTANQQYVAPVQQKPIEEQVNLTPAQNHQLITGVTNAMQGLNFGFSGFGDFGSRGLTPEQAQQQSALNNTPIMANRGGAGDRGGAGNKGILGDVVGAASGFVGGEILQPVMGGLGLSGPAPDLSKLAAIDIAAFKAPTESLAKATYRSGLDEATKRAMGQMGSVRGASSALQSRMAQQQAQDLRQALTQQSVIDKLKEDELNRQRLIQFEQMLQQQGQFAVYPTGSGAQASSNAQALGGIGTMLSGIGSLYGGNKKEEKKD